MKTHITHHRLAVFHLCLLQSAFCLLAWAQPTAFTYQGELSDSGSPANGIYDLRFAVYDAETNGTSIGMVTNAATEVGEGLFTVTLDFGASVFDGDDRWLEIGAVTNGGGLFSTLTPRQAITSTPYAIRAKVAQETEVAFGVAPNSVHDESVIDGSLLAVDVAPGQVVKSLNGMRDDVELLEGPNISLDVTPGTPSVITLSSSDDWKLSGNAGTTPGTHFLGTTDNQALELKVNGQRAVRLEPMAGAPNIIGGSPSSAVSPGVGGAFIGGGTQHSAQANYSVIVGGIRNGTLGADAVVVGGVENWAVGVDSFVGGGGGNTAGQSHSFVGGGLRNKASSGQYAVIGGGYENSQFAFGDYAVIAGGSQNTNTTDYSVISGGAENTIGLDSQYSAIGGGVQNKIHTNATAATIGGGGGNIIESNSCFATIAGGQQNSLAGSCNATVGGGAGNRIEGECEAPTICGGYGNRIEYTADHAAIGGGQLNTIHTNASSATIAGGYKNAIEDFSEAATIAGGWNNEIKTDSDCSVIGGGEYNKIHSDSGWAIIAGGRDNDIGSNALYNTIQGGHNNNIASNVWWSTIAGGRENAVGEWASYAFAAGRRAKAIHEGAFVWADARDASYFSTRANEFSVRAEGGVRIDSSLGIKLNDLDRPLITRGWFPFTSGAYEGVGRFGLFMEPYFLTAGLPTHAAAGFQSRQLQHRQHDQ